MDLYEVLALKPSATDGEVKTAYRILQKAVHPDLAGEYASAAAALVNICAESLAVARPRLLAADAVKIARAGAVGSGADTTARSAEQSAQHIEFCCKNSGSSSTDIATLPSTSPRTSSAV